MSQYGVLGVAWLACVTLPIAGCAAERESEWARNSPVADEIATASQVAARLPRTTPAGASPATVVPDAAVVSPSKPTTAAISGPIATPTPAPTATMRPTSYVVAGPLHLDAAAGRVIASGSSGEVLGTLVLDAEEGRLIRLLAGVHGVTVDAARSRIILDRHEQGIALFDAESLERKAEYALPTAALPTGDDAAYGPGRVAPLVDPRDGTVYVFRGARVLAIDPESGRVTRTIEDWIPGNSSAIRQAVLDADSRTLYLTAYDWGVEAYMHAVDLVGRNLDTGAIILQHQVSDFYDRLMVWDGYLLALSSWGRGNYANMRLWLDGRLLHTVDNWPILPEAAGIVRDSKRDRLLMQVRSLEREGFLLAVIDAKELSLDMLTTSPAPGRLAGYDPAQDRLYFVDETAGLLALPAETVEPLSIPPLPVPQPVEEISLPILVPDDLSMRQRFAWAWLVDAPICRFDSRMSTLVYSADAGRTWQPRQGGIPDCVAFGDVAVSPAFSTDHTLFASIRQLGVYRTKDGGTSWHAASRGLESMLVAAIQVSPDYEQDRTVYAETQTSDRTDDHAWRSQDGGDTWQPLGAIQHLALSPAFVEDRTLFGFRYWSTDVLRSSGGGEDWQSVGQVPAEEIAVAGSLDAIRDPVAGSTVLLAHILNEEGPMLAPVPLFGRSIWRSGDGGSTWAQALVAPGHVSSVASLMGESEGTVLVVSGAEPYQQTWTTDVVLRSTNAGLDWQRVELPPQVHPSTSVALPDGRAMFRTDDGRHMTIDVVGLPGEPYP